jgi:hypothetical protein
MKTQLPAILDRLVIGIARGLQPSEASEFPVQALAAVKPGADLSKVWPRFAVWLLVGDATGGIKKLATPQGQKAIQRVADLFNRELAGEAISHGVWLEARREAADAAAYAAYAAADAADAAAYAAYAAAAADAADAADAAADAADADAAADAADARRLARQQQRDKLLELLTGAPVIEQAAA